MSCLILGKTLEPTFKYMFNISHIFIEYPFIDIIKDDVCDEMMLQSKLQGLLCLLRGYLCPPTTEVWPMRMMETIQYEIVGKIQQI